MKTTSKWRRPQNEDDLRNEDNLENEDDLNIVSQANQSYMASLENQLSRPALYALVRGQPGYVGDQACVVT